MRDIPMFATEFGVASLTLSQIPYTKEAYVRLQDTSEPTKFLSECVDFCKMAGAELVYGTGHPIVESYPLHTAIWKMQCSRDALPDTDACLFPVQDSTMEMFRERYNERMRAVPNAAWLTKYKLKELLATGSGYFVHMDGKLIGLGIVNGAVLEGIVATEKKMGYSVLCALKNAVTPKVIEVEVASANEPAVRLYERAGFLKTGELSRWYKIL